ncbi:MAG: hypothetical protein Q4G05_03790 [Clostridia bacterium]|nr:hypothetical protein [Clostridia bacterium]
MFDKLKKMININHNNTSKRKVENLVVFIIILIITVLIIKMVCSPGNKNTTQEKDTSAQTNEVGTDTANIEYDGLEGKLENILSKIQGVGKVNVLITYSQSSEIIPLYNEDEKETSTQEKDDTGGVRTISETENKREVVYKEIDGSKDIITQSIIKPKIEGAIITAEGGDNDEVKNNIVQAIQAVTGIATHKIQVFKNTI